jgi:hypothetical protein
VQKTCQGISHASIRLGRKLDRPFESGVVMKRAIYLGLAADPHRQDTLSQLPYHQVDLTLGAFYSLKFGSLDFDRV